MRKAFNRFSLFVICIILVISFSSCSLFDDNKPTVELITLRATGETYSYYCFKSVSAAESYFGIRYNYSTEAINTSLDSSVRNVMTSKGYAVSITYISGVYCINRKSGNTYYINFYG